MHHSRQSTRPARITATEAVAGLTAPRTSRLAALALALAAIAVTGGLVVPFAEETLAIRSYVVRTAGEGLFTLLLASALVLGVAARIRIAARRGTATGAQYATAAIIVAVVAGIIFAVLLRVRTAYAPTLCLSNQRRLAEAILRYAQDHDDHLPAAFGELREYLPAPLDTALTCPARGFLQTRRGSYGYNVLLAEHRTATLRDPALTILTADGGNARRLLTGPGDIDTVRHGRGYFAAAFCDGHADYAQLAQDGVLRLRWQDGEEVYLDPDAAWPPVHPRETRPERSAP